MRRTFARGLVNVVGAVAMLGTLASCKPDNSFNPVPRDRPSNGGSSNANTNDNTAGDDTGGAPSGPSTPPPMSSMPDASMSMMDAGPPPFDPDAAVPNCGELFCSGAGRCLSVASVTTLDEVRDANRIVDQTYTRARAEINTNGAADVCQCDEGYIATVQDGVQECVVDESCVRLRLQSCRQKNDDEPAVGMFFSVETCAGTAVLPEKLGNVDEAFAIQEDGSALAEESAATVIERDVESFVTIAIDLSTSVISDPGVLGPLITEVRRLVRSLKPTSGEPPVTVSLIVFGRLHEIAVPIILDCVDLQVINGKEVCLQYDLPDAGLSFNAVDEKLAAIAADPADNIDDPGGTDLNGAANTGVMELEAAVQSRNAETHGDVLAIGTLVLITDGDDTSARQLDIGGTPVNVISVGISADINDAALNTLGPQGSFLAPTQDDWRDAFDRISTRVAQYPESAYLLGYCSPAVAGVHSIEVSLATGTSKATATCSFCAESFGAGQCSVNSLQNYCDAHPQCGSFAACGGCTTPGADGDLWSPGIAMCPK